MGSFSQEVPDLLAVAALFAEAAFLGVFPLLLGLPLPPSLPLLSTFVGNLRRAICLAASSLTRLASIPAATSNGSTSLIRRHSQRADFGHALSLSTSTPSCAAATLSLLCISEEVAMYCSLSSMNLIMACATGDPSSVAWFCTFTTSSQLPVAGQ